jgi:hypothetical protein
MGKTRYIHGDFNIICERTGSKIKRSQARKEWNNKIVRKESFEHRHPMDFLRARPDRQAAEDPRTESSDVYLGANQVQANDLNQKGSALDTTPSIWDSGVSTWDALASVWDVDS